MYVFAGRSRSAVPVEKAPGADGATTIAGADCTGFVRYLDFSIVSYFYLYLIQFYLFIFRKEKKQKGEASSDDDVEAPRC